MAQPWGMEDNIVISFRLRHVRIALALTGIVRRVKWLSPDTRMRIARWILERVVLVQVDK